MGLVSKLMVIVFVKESAWNNSGKNVRLKLISSEFEMLKQKQFINSWQVRSKGLNNLIVM